MTTFANTNRSLACLGALIAVALVATLSLQAPPAVAGMAVEAFTSQTTDSQAGGHPDLSTSFTLAEPGVTEAAESVVFDAPQGLFGNPQALLRCSASDFAFQQCSSNSQAGLVTVYANHNGNPGELLGTAPLYDLDPNPDQTGLFGLIVPIVGVPIQIPVAVRTETDYGLRFTVSGLTQTFPLKQADITFWGFPASHVHDSERFPKAAPGEPAGCPGATTTNCIAGVAASIPNHPLIDNPTVCTGTPLATTVTVRSYQHPEDRTVVGGTYPETTGCEEEVFKPVISANLTTDRTDTASGFDLDLRAPQFFGQSPAPSQLRSAIVTLPPELTINPDAADGQTSCSESAADVRLSGTGGLSRQLQDRHVCRHDPSADGRIGRIHLHRQPQTRRSVPTVLDRQWLGHPRQVPRHRPSGPGNRSDHIRSTEPAAGPVRRLPDSSVLF